MELTNPSMAYLSEALNVTQLTHKLLDKVCEKINVSPEYSYKEGEILSLENRLWTFIKNINNSDNLNKLIKVIIEEYGGHGNLSSINHALNMSGYTVNSDGNVLSYLAEEVKIQEKTTDIESGLQQLHFTTVLTTYKNGVENYGKGNNFQDIRNSIEGLINEILTQNGEAITGLDMRRKMELLLDHNVLNTDHEKFNLGGGRMEFEHAHSYGIWKMLSHYIDHYNIDTGENERHFVFFQSIGLIWFLIKRYQETL